MELLCNNWCYSEPTYGVSHVVGVLKVYYLLSYAGSTQFVARGRGTEGLLFT